MNTFEIQNHIFGQRVQQELTEQFHAQMRQHQHTLPCDSSHNDVNFINQQNLFDVKYKKIMSDIENFDINDFSGENQTRQERLNNRFAESAKLFNESSIDQVNTMEDVKAYFNR